MHARASIAPSIVGFALLVGSTALWEVSYSLQTAHASSDTLANSGSGTSAYSHVKFLEQSTFTDSGGRLNVMGTVRNIGSVPLEVVIGQNVSQNSLKEPIRLTNVTYGHIVWPLSDSPFKITLGANQKPIGPAFVSSEKEIDIPNFSILTLNYTNMAVGESRSLVGTVRNDGQLDLHNVKIFASVHGINMTQLDSVASNIIPLLKPGQQASFVATPDPAVRSKAFYYSCAGFDINEPITTLDLGGGKFLAFDLRAFAKVSSLRYDNASNSIIFDIVHYNPEGGLVGIKIPQPSPAQRIQVLMDGSPYQTNATRTDGSTISINLFIPKGEHRVQIQNVAVVPEYPLAPLALAGALVIAVFVIRSRSVFMNP